MLKLEKTPKTDNITVTLRKREQFFDPCLLKALCIALFIHVGALLSFHITPFFFSSSFIFPPVQVHSDHKSQSISAISSASPVEDDELPPPPIRMIPALEIYSQHSSLTPKTSLDPEVFKPLEERFWPMWQSSLNFPLEEKQFQMAISGELAEYPLIDIDPLLEKMVPISSTAMYVTYRVQMNEKTGQLFWVEKIQSSGKKSIDLLTEKILNNLRFSTPEPQELVSGTISFAVLEEAPHDRTHL